MKKGEIWLVDFPTSNGVEQSGIRPSIIIREVEDTNVVMIIPFTSNPEARRLPFTLVVSPSKQNGLLAKSIALVLQLRAIDRKRVQSKIGSLNSAALKRIDNLLRRMLFLDS